MHFTSTIALAALVSSVIAHPGHDASAEIAERAAFMKTNKRDLSQCSEQMKKRGLEQRAIHRRAAKLKREQALHARDVATVLATNHNATDTTKAWTLETALFAGNASCILSPEVTQGPYYVTGEYVRSDMREDQEGVQLVLDTQVIDMATCEPVTTAMVEIWHCNSTGVYSGIVAGGNGDSSDTSNLDKTFLRALQPTDSEGVAQFITNVPGHYTSRAPHIHVLAHFNGTTYANGTYGGGVVSHVGQIFLDQDLITAVELTAPYNTNTQELTLNEDDTILAQEGATTDPVINYTYLGDDISEGVFGWIAFGIDLTSSQVITGAASLYAEGGVENESSGGGSGSGSGDAPSGTMSGPPASSSTAA